MHDTMTTLVAPAARQGGTAGAPSGGVRLARGLDVPRAESASLEGSTPPPGEVRLARGFNTPSARTASLEGTCTHVVPAPAPCMGI
jgi:hypothetical protein